MAKPTTTTTTNIKAYSLIITTVFLVALPCLRAQLTPVPAPESTVAPGPLAPSPGGDCLSYLFNLGDCLTFVATDSNLTKPDKECCPELSNLLNTKPICLCQMLRDPSQLGMSIDMKKALQLPSACHTPPISLCSVLGVPVGAPTPSEGPSGAPFSGPVAANPALGNRDNGSPRNLASTQHFLVALAILLFINRFY
ncbi:Hypothetical predicted protein [Olea europaea subsp. europaea]|uniref:Bifunctional inhibitor/plant lipid transfer protein/seed storage helical domain-containing protein n=1 Tax=Olea europaea subsp. europaea TaxID=158383 RepID=A0A8S0UXH5_OLEEU|nr:Hypothetical predicted protein [Olea europaea subsp. europaea]